MRRLHRSFALAAALLLLVTALSGAALSVLPALEHVAAPRAAAPAPDLATLAGRVAAGHPGVQQITRDANGQLRVFDAEGAWIVDPASGATVAPWQPSGLVRWITELHRSLFLGRGGRALAGVGALAMLVLSLSGLRLLARRLGGWRGLLGRAPGGGAGGAGGGATGLHAAVGRAAVAGLLLSSLTGLYLSLTVFQILPDGQGGLPPFPETVDGGPPAPVADLAALRAVPAEALRDLVFPYPDDPGDVFTLKTASGEGYVDQATGALLSWQGHGAARRVYDLFYMLHTGEGLWLLGLLLGLSALGVPVLAASGTWAWAAARRGRARIPGNLRAERADTVILVGSEGGTTWGFAASLHRALAARGLRVHTGPMSGLRPAHWRARRMILLAATYGNGDAPAGARGFLDRLARRPAEARPEVAVLGFGDRQFPEFCAYADRLARALEAEGLPRLLPVERINRQSAQEFARWGAALGAALGLPDLRLEHHAPLPATRRLVLAAREDHGAAVGAPTAILRFALPGGGAGGRRGRRRFPRYAAGDLLGVLAPGEAAPRYYSLASSTADGFVEICVRLHPGGACSGFLHGMAPGDELRAFLRRNPAFRPGPGRAPVVLIGAGTGVGPLAGFIRANRARRPMHLYFGARDPRSDYLYAEALEGWRAEGRLHRLITAFSRTGARVYVADLLRRDAERLRALLAGGGQVMVCGGRAMAEDVRAALAEILAPAGLSPALLKREGRYAEDVY